MKKQCLGLLIAGLGLLHVPLASAGVVPITEVFEPDAASYPSNLWGKVAVVQWARDGYILAGPEATNDYAEGIKQEARLKLETYIREAAAHGAKLVVTPELGSLAYPDIPGKPPEQDEFESPQQIAPYVETVPGGKTTVFFAALAKELKIYLHVGVAELDPATTLYYNTVVAFNPDGNIVAKYHKANLFSIESQFFAVGHEPGFYDSPWGQIGIVICADIYSNFPMNIYRLLAFPVLAVSTSWASQNTGMDAFSRGAKQNNSYLLAANQTYFPDSGVINPDGTLQSHIRQSEGVAYGYLPYKNTASHQFSKAH